MKRKFRKSIANLPGMVATWKRALTPSVERSLSDVELRMSEIETTNEFDKNQDGSTELGEEMATSPPIVDNEKSLEERVLFHEEEFSRSEDSVEPEQRTLEIPESKEADLALPKARAQRKAFGTHLTMTSRTGFFNDRIISPSMVRALLFYHRMREADLLIQRVYSISRIGSFRVHADALHGDLLRWPS
jgi:hypothetical protein